MSGVDLTMTTSDGVKLVYDDEGQGRPVLLVHGYDGLRAHWEFQRGALLDAGYRIVTLDQRGHWASDKPTHGLRMSRLGQDLRELIQRLALKDLTLVGHSMGVSAALAMFSISGVEPVKRFVAIEQTPKLVNEEDWPWGARGLTWNNVHDIAYFRAALGQPELEPAVPDGAAMGMTEEAFDHDSVAKLRLDHLVADWRDVLPRLRVPTWVVGGRQSAYYDFGVMEWFAKELPEAHVTCFEDSGHAPHVTEAGEFNRRLLEFIRAH
jgi:non-heme chloroperoxidase